MNFAEHDLNFKFHPRPTQKRTHTHIAFSFDERLIFFPFFPVSNKHIIRSCHRVYCYGIVGAEAPWKYEDGANERRKNIYINNIPLAVAVASVVSRHAHETANTYNSGWLRFVYAAKMFVSYLFMHTNCAIDVFHVSRQCSERSHANGNEQNTSMCDACVCVFVCAGMNMLNKQRNTLLLRRARRHNRRTRNEFVQILI